MATDRPRVQAYIEPELYKRYEDWKKEKGIDKDSPALNQLLAEYFGVSSQSPPNPQSLTKEEINEIIGNSLKSFGQVLDSRWEGIQAEIDSLKQRQEQAMHKLESIQLLEFRLEAVEAITAPIEGLAELPIRELPSESLPKSLNGSELARRLLVAKSVVSNRKVRADFEEWSKTKDPEAIAWRYDRKSMQFFPVKVSG